MVGAIVLGACVISFGMGALAQKMYEGEVRARERDRCRRTEQYLFDEKLKNAMLSNLLVERQQVKVQPSEPLNKRFRKMVIR